MKQFLEHLRAADDAILHCVQKCYLWFFDRTGVFVGTLLFVLATIESAMKYFPFSKMSWLVIVGLAFYGLWAATIHYYQGLSSEAFNLVQRFYRETLIRKLLVFQCLIFAIAGILVGNFLVSVSDLMEMITLGYLACIQVRDREPPEKKHVFLNQGAA